MSVENPMGILQRSAGIVELLAEEGTLTLAEIADRVDTPRPTVYRLSDALEQAGLVEARPGSRIALSRRWLRLGDSARTAMSEWSMAQPVIDALADSTGHTVFLCVPRGDQAVCINWAQGGRTNVLLLLKPGRSLPLYAGAEGRVTLAFSLEDAESTQRYLEQAPFHPYTARTLTTAAKLRRDITRSRSQGYTISDQDVTEGIGALGVPLHTSRTGRFAGSLSLAGLAETLTDHRERLTASLLEAADELASTLP